MKWISVPEKDDPRLPVVFILFSYVIVGITFLNFNRTPAQVGLIVFSTCLLDMLFHYLFKGRTLLFPLSAAISGMSLSILVNYAHGIWFPLLPVFLTVASKYFLTFKGKHVFNPTLFGILASLLLAGDLISSSPSYQWGGNLSVAFFIVTLSTLLVLKKIKRNYLILSFLITYFLTIAVRAYLTRHHIPYETLFLGALTSPAFFLFAFFMITDPRTSPKSAKMQILMGVSIAMLDMFLHFKQSLSTFFFAGGIYFSCRFLFLHARELFASRGYSLKSILQWAPRAAVISVLSFFLLNFFGHFSEESEASNMSFYLLKKDSREAGLSPSEGNILNLADPKIKKTAKWLLSIGDAVAVADVNNDGLQDVFLTYPLKPNDSRGKLYLNQGTFQFKSIEIAPLVKVAQNPVKEGVPSSAVFYDYDNDGDKDLLVVVSFGKTLLLKNNFVPDGQLSFTDVSEELNISLPASSININVADINNDGNIDVLLANALPVYLRDYDRPVRFNMFNLPAPEYEGDRRMLNIMHRTWHDAKNGGPKDLLFFENGRYKKINSTEFGLEQNRWSLDMTFADFNADGWQDLYVANDFGPDEFYLNEQGESFTQYRGKMVGQIGRDTYKGMNASAGDFDNNGLLDIYVSNVHEKLQAEGSLLWMNNGNFSKGALAAFQDGAVVKNALNEKRFGWGAAVGDIDQDGLDDILQANGHIDNKYDPSEEEGCPDYWYWNEKVALTGPDVHGYADSWADLRGRCIFPYERDRVYLNRGQYFVDVAAKVGWDALNNSRGVSLVDLDNDGDLDVLVTHYSDEVTLFENKSNKSFIGFKAEGNAKTCNRDALGTKVTIKYSVDGQEKSKSNWVFARNGLGSQSDIRLLFGLGNYIGPVDVEVDWCGQKIFSHYRLEAGKYHPLKMNAY